ncbi:MAG TPA: DUF975 family protein [Pirellulales bacterium]|nr:DUF975 family protein [Pirellulales bacterium]
MSIEFPCSQCGKVLRVGDDAAGKQARCPSCNAVQAIPGQSAIAQNPFTERPAVPAMPAPPVQSDNPYQSPASASWYPGSETVQRPLQPQPLDAGDVLNRTWIIFKEDFWMMALVGFVFWICQASFGFVVGQVVSFSLMGARGGQPAPADVFTIQLVVQALAFLFGTWLEAGMAIYMLKVARGQPAEIGALFSGARFWPVALAARFLIYLAVTFGILLLIVPGIIFALMYSQMFYLVVDRELGVMESLSTSSKITSGNKLQLFVLALATIGVSMLGALVCCVGAFPAIGFVALMWAVAYLAMTGQPTAAARIQQPVASPFAGPSAGELR